MAMRRKGSRLITVDSVQYRWRIRHRVTEFQIADGFSHGLTVAVEKADRPGCVLIADFSKTRPLHWQLLHPAPGVTPSEVADAIRASLSAGWQPEQKGSAFRWEVKITKDPPNSEL